LGGNIENVSQVDIRAGMVISSGREVYGPVIDVWNLTNELIFFWKSIKNPNLLLQYAF